MKPLSVIAIALTPASFAVAQSEGGPSPERFFGFIDRNRDGVIDKQEAEQAPGPVRDALLGMRIDRGVTLKDFEQVMPKLMDDFRRRRDEGGSRYSSSSSSRDEPRREEYRREEPRREESRSEVSRSSSEPSRTDEKAKSTSKKAPPPKRRVTTDLPASFSTLDVDHDGQVGLYEWDRARLSDFLLLDRNFDGILTPKELIAAKNLAPVKAPVQAPNTPAVSTSSVKSAAVPVVTPAATAKPSSPTSILAPAKVDPDSQEGRMAKFVFGRLDLNHDGSLTEDEWNKSQTTRASFEKAGVRLSLPSNADQFAGWQIAVQKAGGGK